MSWFFNFVNWLLNWLSIHTCIIQLYFEIAGLASFLFLLLSGLIRRNLTRLDAWNRTQIGFALIIFLSLAFWASNYEKCAFSIFDWILGL